MTRERAHVSASRMMRRSMKSGLQSIESRVFCEVARRGRRGQLRARRHRRPIELNHERRTMGIVWVAPRSGGGCAAGLLRVIAGRKARSRPVRVVCAQLTGRNGFVGGHGRAGIDRLGRSEASPRMVGQAARRDGRIGRGSAGHDVSHRSTRRGVTYLGCLGIGPISCICPPHSEQISREMPVSWR